MPKNAKNGGLWAYLDASGVLEKGTEEEIKAAKKAYRKQYLLNYKRRQRASKPEFAVTLNKDNGEYFRIKIAAKQHSKTIPAFLRLATLAYINKTYIVPDRLLIAKLEQLLSDAELRQRLGEQGRLRVEFNYSLQKSALRLINLIQQAKD